MRLWYRLLDEKGNVQLAVGHDYPNERLDVLTPIGSPLCSLTELQLALILRHLMRRGLHDTSPLATLLEELRNVRVVEGELGGISYGITPLPTEQIADPAFAIPAQPEVEGRGPCEGCNRIHQCTLVPEVGPNYKLCLNCLSDLVNYCLTPWQYFRLRKGRDGLCIADGLEFYLHTDFYNPESGEALQPSTQRRDLVPRRGYRYQPEPPRLPQICAKCGERVALRERCAWSSKRALHESWECLNVRPGEEHTQVILLLVPRPKKRRTP